MGWWLSGYSGEEEKGENAQAGWDLHWGQYWPAPFQKAEPRPKAAGFEEVLQGWPLRTCSAFFHCAWVKIPNAFAFFSFFLDQLIQVPVPTIVGFSWSKEKTS
ncbi:hypothetical protein ACQKK5_11955 [Brevibacillus panacihumi]|uniref:hypothetical protein n=1 Tax=Brevibacillus panacihumi TaxID=497735 RepID=UPI003CFD0858